jgi:putative ABC transport system substrate-binding protein
MRLARLATTVLALALLAAPLAAEAQPVGKVPQVGVLSPGSPPVGALDAFRQGLRELGYLEGRDIVIEWRFSEGKDDRLPGLARELVQQNVDVLVAVNTPAALAAKNSTKSIPIVITRVADPVSVGLVASLARPGGNITGESVLTAEMSAKRVELLKEALPGLSRVGVLWSTGNPGSALTVRELEISSRRLGIQLQTLGVHGPGDIRGAFEAARKGRAGALYVVDDVITTSHRAQIVDFARGSRLPVISQYAEFAEQGGLMAYGPSITTMYRRTAYFVDRILKGARPGDLPIEQPTKFELVINLKAAKALGLTIPPSVLARADEIIQ